MRRDDGSRLVVVVVVVEVGRVSLVFLLLGGMIECNRSRSSRWLVSGFRFGGFNEIGFVVVWTAAVVSN